MRKLLALFLVLAMLIPLCIFSASAEGEPVISGATSIVKARYGSISVDGSFTSDDQAMAIDTLVGGYKNTNNNCYVGVSWSDTEDNMYVGLINKKVECSDISWNGATITPTSYSIKSVEIALENGTYSWTAAEGLSSPDGMDGAVGASTATDFIEFGIPLSAIVVYQRENGDIYASAKITVKTDSQTECFDGCIVFTAETIAYSTTIAGTQTGIVDYTNIAKMSLGAYGSGDGLRILRLPRTNTTNGAFQLHALMNDSKSAVFTEGECGAVSFDYTMANPDFKSTPRDSEVSADWGPSNALSTTQNGFRSLIYIGIGYVYNSRNTAPSQFMFSIYNTDNDLVLYYDDRDNSVDSGSSYYEQSVALNISVGTVNKIALEWSPTENGYRFDIRVNGLFKGSIYAKSGNTFAIPHYRGTGVALGIASDDLSTANNGSAFSSSNRDVTYKNISLSTSANESVLCNLLKKYGFLADGAAFQTPTEGTNAVRFLTKVEDLDYNAVGFKVTATYNGKSATVTKTTTQVFESIVADGKTVSGEGKYWMAAVINGIPTDKEVILEVRPFVVTPDNVTIYGYCGTVTLNGTN